MRKQIQYVPIIISILLGMYYGANYEDLSNDKTATYQFVDNRHIIDTVQVKDTIIKEKVLIRWRTRKVCCCDSICCGNRH